MRKKEENGKSVERLENGQTSGVLVSARNRVAWWKAWKGNRRKKKGGESKHPLEPETTERTSSQLAEHEHELTITDDNGRS